MEMSRRIQPGSDRAPGTPGGRDDPSPAAEAGPGGPDLPRLSVVIPCYNEAANLSEGCLDFVLSYLSSRPYRSEVIVVDDGSHDESRQILRRILEGPSIARVIENPHWGKAYAVKTGLLEAAGDLVLFTDMDQATPIDEVEKFLPAFEEGYDIVIGSRGMRRQGATLKRRLTAFVFVLLRDLLLGFRGIRDTQCGFKCFRREVVQDIIPRLRIYGGPPRDIRKPRVTAGFDLEVLFIAAKMGYRIKQVPVRWHHRESRRVLVFSEGLLTIRDLLRIRMNNLRSLYGRPNRGAG